MVATRVAPAPEEVELIYGYMRVCVDIVSRHRSQKSVVGSETCRGCLKSGFGSDSSTYL